MMTDRDAFIRAIVENPADDQPRLIYGDWLREHGEDDRAEFIDVQCELARTDLLPAAHVYVGRGDRCGRDEITGRLGGNNLDGVIPGALVDWTAEGVDGRPGESWSGVGLVEEMSMDDHGLTVRIIPWYGQRRISQRCDALRRRERELLDAHGGTWFRWLPRPDGYLGGWSYAPGPVATGGPDNPSLHAVVRRGFVEEVTLPESDFAERGGALLKATPLRRVTLTGCGSWAHEITIVGPGWSRSACGRIAMSIGDRPQVLTVGGVVVPVINLAVSDRVEDGTNFHAPFTRPVREMVLTIGPPKPGLTLTPPRVSA